LALIWHWKSGGSLQVPDFARKSMVEREGLEPSTPAL
jgi:hypothetical protein